jgi:hypothetical protein
VAGVGLDEPIDGRFNDESRKCMFVVWFLEWRVTTRRKEAIDRTARYVLSSFFRNNGTRKLHFLLFN